MFDVGECRRREKRSGLRELRSEFIGERQADVRRERGLQVSHD
jgi:hypothetical protein